MTQATPKKGELLIAEPSLTGDVAFNRSVVLLVEHNNEGSVGFILNKPLDSVVQDFVPQIKIGLNVFNGGPVEQNNLYFIHKVPHLISDSLAIANGLYWGGDFEKTIALINQKIIGENDIRFFLGYSGWASEQLKNELSSKSWVLAPNKYKKGILDQAPLDFWKDKMLELGGDYIIWSNAPEDPNLN